MNITIGQLLFDFMPCKYEYELLILQRKVKYNREYLEDDTWFRKEWKDKAKDDKEKTAVNKNCYKRRYYGG